MAKRHPSESAILEAALEAATKRIPNFDINIASGDATFPAVEMLQTSDVLAFAVLVMTRDACHVLMDQKEQRVSACTWCFLATPEDKREDLPRRTPDESREHIFTCEHSPTVKHLRELSSCLEAVLKSNATSYRTSRDGDERFTYHVEHHVAETIKLALQRLHANMVPLARTFRIEPGDRMVTMEPGPHVKVPTPKRDEGFPLDITHVSVTERGLEVGGVLRNADALPIGKAPTNLTEEDIVKLKAFGDQPYRPILFDVEGPGVPELRAALARLDHHRENEYPESSIKAATSDVITFARRVVGQTE